MKHNTKSQESPLPVSKTHIDDIKHELSRIFYENNFDSYAEANDLGFIGIDKMDRKNFNGSINRDESSAAKSIQSPDAFFSFSNNKPLFSFSPAKSYSPIIIKHPQSGFKFTSAKGSNQNEGSNNFYNSSRPMLFGSKDSNFSPLRRLDDSERPTFTNHKGLLYDDNLSLMNDEPLNLIWSNNASRSQSASKSGIIDPMSWMKTKNQHNFDEADIGNSIEKKRDNNSNTYNQGLFEEHFRKEKFRENIVSPKNKNNSQVSRNGSKKKGKNIIASQELTEEHEDIAIEDIGDMYDNSDEEEGVLKSRIISITDLHKSNMENMGNRSSRGLRVLSQKVKEIVQERKHTSYKEVADILSDISIMDIRVSSDSTKPKDEQNVKRRVYDALNVLIAADILKKRGKTVYSEERFILPGGKKSKSLKDKVRMLSDKMSATEKRLIKKQEALREMIYKSLAIKQLLYINRIHGWQRPPVRSILARNDSTHIKSQKIDQPKEGEVVSFPFIVVATPQNKNARNKENPKLMLDMSTDRKELHVESKSFISIYGDIDILLKLDLHHTSKAFFEESLEEGLKKYVPLEFEQNLK